MPATEGVHVGVVGAFEPRLVIDDRHEGLSAYTARGGYAALADADVVLQQIADAGLRGRGGAAFPTARKIAAVRQQGGTPVLVANGEEGEPTSVKDRWLLRTRPHLVLDGVLRAAAVVGADVAYLYVSDPDAARSLGTAIEELAHPAVELVVTQVEHAYVAGEETAAVNFLNGGPAKPTDKPPRPFEKGVHGRPTLVSNVETLANLPILARLGPSTYRELGTAASPGTFLATIGGWCATPGLYEVPFGTPLRTVLEHAGGTPGGEPVGALFGGYFGGLVNRRALDLPLDYDAATGAGCGLGCGAITVLGPMDCPVRVAADVMAFFARENAGQCGSCFNGTAAMSGLLAGLVRQEVGPEELDRLRHLSRFLRRRGACGTLDGASHLAGTLLDDFPDEVRTHLEGSCPWCLEATVDGGPPFAFPLPAVTQLQGSAS